MIQVTLTLELARLLHQYPDSHRVPAPATRPFAALLAYLKAAQLQLTPDFIHIQDVRLLPYFTLIATKPIPEATLQELLRLPGVEGAYRKPDDTVLNQRPYWSLAWAVIYPTLAFV